MAFLRTHGCLGFDLHIFYGNTPCWVYLPMQRHRKPISGTHGFSVQKQGFLDGFLGGEFRVTFRVHDRSHNEVQKLETPMRTPLLTTSEKMANLQTPPYEGGEYIRRIHSKRRSWTAATSVRVRLYASVDQQHQFFRR